MNSGTKFCRVCVLEKQNVTDFMQVSEGFEKKITFKEMYNDCSPIKIIDYDPYPMTICFDCQALLLQAFEFREKCRRAQTLLCNVFKPSIVRKRRSLSTDCPSNSKSIKTKNIDFENVIERTEIICNNPTVPEDGDCEDEYEWPADKPTTSKLVSKSIMRLADGKEIRVIHPKDREFIESNEVKSEENVQDDNHPDLGMFKMTILNGYKNSSNVIYEANGFLYINTRNTTNRRYLRCSTMKNCPGKACIDILTDPALEEELYVYRLHNHQKETLHISKLKFLQEMRTIAQSGNFTARQIYLKAIEKFPNLAASMPYSTLSSRLYRLTGNQHFFIENLTKFAEVLVTESPAKYCKTHDGKEFFQDAIGDEEMSTCSVIFANTDLIESMSWSNEIFIDTSFRVDFDNGRSQHFMTICISVNEHRFPVLYALMDSLSLEDLIQVLTLFKDKYAPDLHPEEIITDYNADLFKALNHVYKHSNISGSLVHYIFAIYKQCNVIDIVKEIEMKPICMKILTNLYALPILPPPLIPGGLEFIKDKAKNYSCEALFEPLFMYVQEVWINSVTPQVFTNYCNMDSINENIFVVYKRIRDSISANKKFGFFDINDKLLSIDDWSTSLYKKVLLGEKLKRQGSAMKYSKVLDKWWQPNMIEKHGYAAFFDALNPLIDKMTGLIWIWGLYNYNGLNDETLITQEDYFGCDVTKQMIDENTEQQVQDIQNVEIIEEEMTNGESVITLQILDYD
ncbi:PREDICTED: uncharacterized protein LOC108566889 [Nicrophorus vespilloides]|uniref:Uncharacterized protein LOC108566889 n=1 Tax=Nicrophorus vespilloides TaxID=110193 RepID=A0ABM1N6P0_NICVS|nr:PREDICTED: uncharacterized protein LOC108566889 [Nicrophorus vespilloides]